MAKAGFAGGCDHQLKLVAKKCPIKDQILERL
jgi:hypothetical protein